MTLWCDGKFLPDDTLVAGPFDPGLSVGDGLFETMAVYHGRIFARDQHVARLNRSVTALGFAPVEWDIAAVCTEVARHSAALPVARLRVTLWHRTGNESHLAVSLREEPNAPLLGMIKATDARVGIGPWIRDPANPLTGHKSTSYGGNIAALRWGKTRSFDEVLWRGRWGGVCEGTTANLLFVHQDKLYTPADDSGCLPGVTRNILTAIGDELGGVLMMAARDLSNINVATSGLALVGTFRGVHAVGHVDNKPVHVKTLIREAQTLFADRMHDFLTN